MALEVWWGNLRGAPVEPGVGGKGGDGWGNYCYYFETQIAEIRESMMKNHIIKTTKKVTAGSI